MYRKTEEQRQRYFAEVKDRLRREGFETIAEYTDLAVKYDGKPLCKVEDTGGVTYRQENITAPEAEAAKDKVYEISTMTAEYMRLMEAAPFLKADGLEDKFKCLSEFNGTVFAGQETKYGVQFVTWDRDFQGTGVCNGHYFTGNYLGAKEDFAVRAGFIDKNRLFSAEQTVEIYRCCTDALEGGYDLPIKQADSIERIRYQIEDQMPDIAERIKEEPHNTIETQIHEHTM